MNVIAIDSGGTKIVGSVVDGDGNILDRERIPNAAEDSSWFRDVYREIILRFRDKWDAKAVGLSFNCRIDGRRGVIMDCPRYPEYQGTNVAEQLRQLSGLPSCIHNDADSAVYGEIWKGAARNAESVAGLIIGTGLGGAVYEDGHFLRGFGCGAGEIGHQILRPDGAECFCGQRGCVERYVSGTGLWECYNRRLGCRAIASGYAFFERLHRGDETARAVLDGFVRDLAVVLVNMGNVLNPEIFLIGGGLADTRADWMEDLESTYRAMTGAFLRDTRIVYAEKGNDAALLGAARFAFDLLEKRA